MTAQTSNRAAVQRDGTRFSFPVLASTHIYQGSLVVLDSSGWAKPGVTATGLIPAGVALLEANNSSGANGDIQVSVRSGVSNFVNGDTITKTSIGDQAFISDDQTVTKANAGQTAAGIIVDVDSTYGVWVEVGPAMEAPTVGLLAANNLSDVGSVATSRSSLGLDTGDSPTFTTVTTSANIVGQGTTDSTSSTTGAFKTAGGLGVAKAAFIGTTLGVVGKATYANGLTTQTATYTVQTPAIDGDSTICDLTDNAVITLPAIAAGNDGMKITLVNTAANGAAKIQYTVTGGDRITGTIGAVTVASGTTLVNTKVTAIKGDYACLTANNALKLWLITGGVGVWA